MKTIEEYLKSFHETILDLKTDARMLEGYSRFVDESTADYHNRLCGYFNQHITNCELLVGILEKCVETRDKVRNVS